MKTYAVQDGGWDWDSEQGLAVIVEAASPEEAAAAAIKKLREQGVDLFDAIDLKIAELNVIGFCGWDVETGLDPFCALPQGQQ